MADSLVAVMTTIQEPTQCCRELGARLSALEAPLLVIGDAKGPASFDLPGARLFKLQDQAKLPYRLASRLPTKHYARKNIGYLIAIESGAACIYETDDDNAPLPGPAWGRRALKALAQPVQPRRWMNVYRLFSESLIWPRGFPLHLVRDDESFRHDRAAPSATFEAPIQQGLANQAPDVDAVWRLILDQPLDFTPGPSVWLPSGTYCPFNSQSTWWWPAAFTLMYLPSFCSFRMTDIWRSFIAQRCLWEMGLGVIFHGPEVYQLRNTHNLMRDFEDEVPGYVGNDRLVQVLDECRLSPGRDTSGDNLRACYDALVRAGFVPDKELALVDCWLADIRRLMG